MARGESERLSGTVLAVDVNTGTLVISEVGPWRVTDGETDVRHEGCESGEERAGPTTEAEIGAPRKRARAQANPAASVSF
jgi:hypothetical protein